MEARLTTAVKDRAIDLESFMDVWSLLSSKDLLQALEASAGKTVSLFVFESKDARVEMLLDVASARVGVDLGKGARWGGWSASGDEIQISLDDGSVYKLSGLEPGATLSG
jgi:hypothetical protein